MFMSNLRMVFAPLFENNILSIFNIQLNAKKTSFYLPNFKNLPTNACLKMPRFCKKNKYYIDISNQRNHY